MTLTTLARTGNGCFLPVFLFLWCGILLVFDGVIATQLYQQWDADQRFREVPAQVEEARVELHSDSEGSSYRPVVRFSYEVDGQAHTSDRIGFAVWGSSDRQSVEQILEGVKPGATVTAWYDPDDPAVAILRKGLGGFPAILVIFLIPFHCVALGIWLGTRRARRLAGADDRLAAMLEQLPGDRVLFRPLRLPFSIWFVCTLGLSSFLGVFALLLSAGMNPSFGLVFAVAGALLLFAFAAAWLVSRNASGRFTLDRARKTILVGRSLDDETMTLNHEASIHFEDVTDVVVTSERKGEVNGRPWFRHDLTLHRKRGEPIPLTSLRGPADRAAPIVAWLRGEIGMERS